MMALLIRLFWYPVRRVDLGNRPPIFRDPMGDAAAASLAGIHPRVLMFMWVAANGMHTFLGVYMSDLGGARV